MRQEIAFQPWELVLAVAWSPDGKLLAVSAGVRLLVYAIGTSGEAEPASEVMAGAFLPALAFSPDDAWLAAGSRDGMLRVWNVDALLRGERDPAVTIAAHKKGVNSLAFQPQGGSLASGGNDAVARTWDLASGSVQQQIIGGTHAVPGVAFSPDGSLLAILNGDLVRLREASSGRMAASLQLPYERDRQDNPRRLYSLAISPDGKWLAAGDNAGTVWVWQVVDWGGAGPAGGFQAEEPRQLIPAGRAGETPAGGDLETLVWSLGFSVDSRWLAAAGGDGYATVWEVASGRQLGRVVGKDGSAMTAAAFQPGGALLATGGLDAVLRLWTLTTPSSPR